MKTIISITTIFFMVTSTVSAQKMELDLCDLSKIEVYCIYGKINIVGTNENKIFIEVTKQKEVPAMFNSLKFDVRESNTKIDLHIENNGSILRIYPSLTKAIFSDYLIKAPNSFRIKIDNTMGDRNKTWSPASFKSVMSDTILIQNIINDIAIDASFFTSIKITDVSGPIVAKSFFGDIYIKFSSLNQVRPTSIESFSGQISLVLPKSVNCDIEQSSYSGKFNTEIELSNLEVKTPDPRIMSEMTVASDEAYIKTSGKINTGGVILLLKTFSGDVNLRKDKYE